MNKKVLKAVFVAAIAMVSGINVFNAQKSDVLSDTILANVEALAGCESSVKAGKGRPVIISCVNSSGDFYELEACDFDEGYSEDCNGRQAND